MLHTHDDFLKAIAATPADRTLRLVFADWLDEHAQPEQAELIRIEEEMRALPVFSDRFWELKPRRNALRTLAGAEWCGQMRYGTECEPVFRHGIPDGWRERWRLIREFTERWHRVPMGDVDGRHAWIGAIEKRLKRKLPASVREWLAVDYDAQQTSPRESRTFWNPYVNAVNEYVQRSNRDHAIVLYEDDEFYWGIRYIDFHIPDPPVYLSTYGTRADQNSSFEPTEENLTKDVLKRLTSRLHMEDMVIAVANDANKLRQQLVSACGPPQQFANSFIFEATNLLVVVEPANWEYSVGIRVVVLPGTKREQVPAFLWDYAQELGTWGIFAQPR